MSDEAISRLNAALQGRYRIEGELGEGGMAIVFLAEDLKHRRKVALKVLKPELAAAVGAERFLAEIETTANLQHPNILPLFDSGEADSFLFYVMPRVEGESLRARLDREGQLPIEDAVRIASNVAEALDHAHRKGVVHRDVNPANVLLQDGRPLVSDFGIALAVGAAGGGRLTATGLSLGTPHYMSPEQASGDAVVGPASDVYSLGCVLYEALVGEPPHQGRSAQAILGKLLTERPTPATQRRPNVPTHVEAALRKALEPIPADRFASAAAFARALHDPGFRHGAGEGTAAGARDARAWPVAAALVALAAGFAAGRVSGPRPAAPDPVIRYGVTLSDDEALATGVGANLAISPDGARIAYVGPSPDGDGTRLWLRERDELSSRPIPGTDGARQPFFSPDGDRIGFVTPERVLRVMGLAGEDPLDLVEGGVLRSGATWGLDGYIYFDTTAPHGLERIAATGGGRPEIVFGEPLEEDVVAQGWPSLLPGGHALLFTIWRNTQTFGVGVLSLETGEIRELAEGVAAAYAPTGHLVHVDADGSMYATPFDASSLELTGAPVLLRELGAGFMQVALSESGRLAWTSTSAPIDEAVWVDRSGVETPIAPAGTVRNVRFVAVSPDGRRLAINTRDHPTRDDGQVWIKELPDGPLTRLTFEGVVNFRPEFFAGGDSVLFISDRAGNRDVWKQRADGSGEAQLVFDDSVDIDEALLSPDGQWLVYREGNQDGERDIYARRNGSDGAPLPIAATAFDEVAPALSPDGRWLAYSARVEGQWDIYVRPFPQGEGLWRVSSSGGFGPVWSPDGRELLYQVPADALAAVSVLGTDPISFGSERHLFSSAPYGFAVYHRRYDVAPDGGRYVMVRAYEADVVEERLYVVENFHTELTDRVPRE